MSESGEQATAAHTSNQNLGCGCLTLVAIVAVVIWVLSAVFGGDDQADNPLTRYVSPTPVSVPAVTTSISDQRINEQSFLTMLRLKYPQYAKASDESVIAVGNGVCGDLAAGKTFVQVGLAIAEGGNVSPTDGAYIAGAAIGSICPQYKSEIG